MAKRVQRLGHTTAVADAFTGLVREVTVDTTKNALRVHDGSTRGGHELAKDDLSNAQAVTATQDGKLTAAVHNQIQADLLTAQADAAAVQTNLDVHELDTAIGVHGSTAAAVASTLMHRDAAGRAQVVGPAANDDIATKTYVDNAVATTLGAPSGTRMLFQQTAAPTAWTKDVTANLNDTALRIVTGTVGSQTAQQAFSVVIGSSGKTATNAHTLSIPEMPSHTHPGGATSNANRNSGPSSNISAANTGSTGGGGGHTHNMDIRLNHHDVIVATKD